MTVLEATHAVAAALQAGDLEAAAQAIEKRGRAIAAGASPTPEALEAGNALLRDFNQLRQRAAYDSARIEQIRRYVEFRKTVD